MIWSVWVDVVVVCAGAGVAIVIAGVMLGGSWGCVFWGFKHSRRAIDTRSSKLFSVAVLVLVGRIGSVVDKKVLPWGGVGSCGEVRSIKFSVGG